jgi:putative alpha-1,2-mannosidase
MKKSGSANPARCASKISEAALRDKRWRGLMAVVLWIGPILCDADSVHDPVAYVLPQMGTDSRAALSSGKVYPAIARPWGMNFWTPQTGKNGDGWPYTWGGAPRSPQNSPTHRYIQSMRLNGRVYTRNFLDTAVLQQGGRIDMEMAAEPNTRRGTGADDAPYSFSKKVRPD